MVPVLRTYQCSCKQQRLHHRGCKCSQESVHVCCCHSENIGFQRRLHLRRRQASKYVAAVQNTWVFGLASQWQFKCGRHGNARPDYLGRRRFPLYILLLEVCGCLVFVRTSLTASSGLGSADACSAIPCRFVQLTFWWLGRCISTRVSGIVSVICLCKQSSSVQYFPHMTDRLLRLVCSTCKNWFVRFVNHNV